MAEVEAMVMGLFAETPLHVGAGDASGAVDLPVAREACGFPIIPGSGLKGALREKATWTGRDGDGLFGTPDHAGGLIVGDARLLLLPVRSLSMPYFWVTCPLVLERFARDLALAGSPFKVPVWDPQDQEAVMAEGEGNIFLEEWTLTRRADPSVASLVDTLRTLVHHERSAGRLARQLAVVQDSQFSLLARHGLEIRAHNKLSDETKTSENLWYEEFLPADSLLYAVLGRRPGPIDALAEVGALFQGDPYLHVGANETTGGGWCAVRLLREDRP